LRLKIRSGFKSPADQVGSIHQPPTLRRGAGDLEYARSNTIDAPNVPLACVRFPVARSSVVLRTCCSDFQINGTPHNLLSFFFKRTGDKQ
jgi:hypothetical protein